MDEAMQPTAEEILNIADHEAARLFPGGEAAVASRYRELARHWHPDRNPSPHAAAVFSHLTALRERATGRAARERRFETRCGRTYRLRWRTRHLTDAGELLVGDRYIAHLIAHETGLRPPLDLPGPGFADDRMRQEMQRFLPETVAVLETEAATIFVERKRPDQVLLADLLRLGPVDPRHAAWMITKLLNLCCWLHWARLSHGAIGPTCLLVSPSRHEVALTGPMICAARFGRAFALLPERTLDLLPRLAAPGAAAEERIDLELVRLTIREALGDSAGVRLAASAGIPRAFAEWLLMPPLADAPGDFAGWQQARDRAFGPPTFVDWNFDPAEVPAD
jgi:hypothetical protein